MNSFYGLYHRLLNASVRDTLDEELQKNKIEDFDPYHLDCLLNPDRHPLILPLEDCCCSAEEKKTCGEICFFDAIKHDEKGNVSISDSLCTGCSACIDNCKYHKLAENKSVLPVLKLLMKREAPVYAMIAPAFIRQFHPDMTQGKLRSALKSLGFAGMIEVALFADMLTLKEAIEFDRSIKNDQDFVLTSCCCPMWIAMIRRVYTLLVPHMPPSVSPMVACGRGIKKLYPNAKTVFIGPCIAKKAEAREPDIADAVDFVLTFQEIRDIFDSAGIDPENYEEDLRDHSSAAGRIYARTGGVSEAVQNTVNRLHPNREIPLRAEQANGIPECRAMLNRIVNGEITANFIEGMGCVGGCVGGPKSILPKEQGRDLVERYSVAATYDTPVDNPYVIELLHRIGFDTIESLLEDNDIFIRKFEK